MGDNPFPIASEPVDGIEGSGERYNL